MHQQYSKTREPRAQDQCTWWKVDWGRDIMQAVWRPSVSTVCERHFGTAPCWSRELSSPSWACSVFTGNTWMWVSSTLTQLQMIWQTWRWSLLVLSFQLDPIINYGEYSTDAPVTIFDLGDWLFDLLDVSKCPLFLLCWSPSLLPARGLAFYLSLSRCLWSKPMLQWWLVPNEVCYGVHMLVCGTLCGQKVSERSENPQISV